MNKPKKKMNVGKELVRRTKNLNKNIETIMGKSAKSQTNKESLMEKLSYTGKQFIFHIFKTTDNNVEISLSSHYVNPPISRKELGELAKFIDSFIESGE